MPSTSIWDKKMEKAVLIVGFFSLATATMIAHFNPARTYEVSLYAATPLAFWVGTVIATFAAVGVAVHANDSLRNLAVVLSGVTILSVVALPVIRGYYFFGRGDALTHLGWAREIGSGMMNPETLLYPGIHITAVILGNVTGEPIRQTLLWTVLAFVLVYLIFLPLCARAMDPQRRTFVFSALAACLLLPINGVSLFAQPHPATQAVLFLPLPLYLAVKYITNDGESSIPFVKTPFSILLALSSIAILLVHPQQTANVVLVYASVVGVQWLYYHFRPKHAIVQRHRSLLGQTGFLVILLLIWMPTHQRASGSAGYLVRQLIFESNTPASDISQQAGGLVQVGGSIESMFMKLFLISAVFCAIAGVTLLVGTSDRLTSVRSNMFSKYVIVGLVPVFGLFGAYMITSTGKFHFRQLGFIMVLMSLFGAIGLSNLVSKLEHHAPNPTLITPAIGILFIVMIITSGSTLFHSPYTFQSSEQVTRGEMTGYETTFEHRGEPTYIGLRSPGNRIADALYGVRENNPRTYLGESIYADTPATGKNFSSQYLLNYYDSSHYLPISDRGYQREVRVYNGIRFSRRGFRTLDAQPGIGRVQSGGGLRVYVFNGSE
ncbi:hypothetical protein [Haladaptatus sp. DFWS20]|uniref:hypothetical protein n=1 Tax=Haladaptatus sp. DFWS20 TaxID=3403467 RepID=UPI003EBBEB82